MITRKLQSIGGSSFSITLPKDWLELNNLSNQDKVYLISNPDSLLIYPQKNLNHTKLVEITIRPQKIEHTKREIVASYLAGHQHLILTGSSIDADTRSEIEDLLQRLIGFVILEITSQSIIIQNIFDPDKFPVMSNLSAMFDGTNNMIPDICKAIEKHDISLASDVINRDVNIDRLYFSLLRSFHLTLKRIEIDTTEDNISTDVFKQYVLMGLQLERMADHACKIALLQQTEKFTHPKEIEFLKPYQIQICSNLKTLKQAIIGLEIEEIHKLYDDALVSQKKINNYLKSLQSDPETYLLFDSIDRLFSYIINICDFGIDLCFLER